MATNTLEEKQQIKAMRQDERNAKKAERAHRQAERIARSTQAMQQGPDVYAKRVIASALQVPFIHFWYSLIYIILDYVLGGHIIVKNWQKLLVLAGYVSEGALGVAGVWALVNHVAIIHNVLAGNLATKPIIDPMNAFMMSAFTLIPDLILASAVLITFQRWAACRQKEKRALSVLWALSYSACSITFFVLTIYTLSSVGSVAGSGDVTKVVYASGAELQIRVVSSFLYGLIEVLYAYEHRGKSAHMPLPNQAPAIDLEKLVNDALAKQASEQAQVIAELKTELGEVKQAASLPQILPPPIDPSVLVEAATEAILRQFEAKFEALNQQVLRQSVLVTETENEANSLPQLPASTRRNEAKPSASTRAKRGKKQDASTGQNEAENIIRLVPASATREEMKAEAIRLHEEEGLSSYEIEKKLGKSAKTIQNWLKKTRDEAENEAESEVIEATN